MRKLLSLLMVGIFLFSGFGAIASTVGFSSVSNSTYSNVVHTLNFSRPILTDTNGESTEIHLQDSYDYLSIPGMPLMPKILKTYELPFGITNIKVDMNIEKIFEQQLSQKISTTPYPVIPTSNIKYFDIVEENDQSSQSNTVFPRDWCSCNVGIGLNGDNERVTFLTIHIYPVKYHPQLDRLLYIENAEISISYTEPELSITQSYESYDLVIIAPDYFCEDLERLVDHKNNHGVKTLLKSTSDIYAEVDGRDKPEQIKVFIKESIEQFNITYVLLVGGLNSLLYAKPKDDRNQGSSDWHVPVRYSNMRYIEPGYLCDLYYADIYKEGGEFDDWDSNDNNIFAEGKVFNPDVLDLYPDVAVGRLACRNKDEVKAVVTKIITYENGAADPSWFKKIVGITGDSFLDQYDLDFHWNTTSLPDGEYRICAQSTNDQDASGPIDQINVILDRSQETVLSFNHDDNLQISSYPGPPIAEIVSVSEGNILGNSDYRYVPTESEAYCNDFSGWANIEYLDGVLAIRGKSYDPQLYGNITDMHVWIENADGDLVFNDWRNNTKMFAEGDWIVGEQFINNRGGAMYYMPDDFEKIMISTSNGKFTVKSDVINVLSQGSGFVFFSVHGSPGSLGNHLPGIPGNRHGSYINGLTVTNLSPYFPFVSMPILPMKTISNTNKLPVVVVGLGCHNANFNVSLVTSFLDLFKPLSMHTYGHPIPECLCWYFVKLPDTGAIASIGYSDYGLGNLGEGFSMAGLDGWITTEFFRQYGEEHRHILGVMHRQAIANYITHFKEYENPEWEDWGWDWGDQMTVEGWTLLGDPSLQIGGYP